MIDAPVSMIPSSITSLAPWRQIAEQKAWEEHHSEGKQNPSSAAAHGSTEQQLSNQGVSLVNEKIHIICK